MSDVAVAVPMFSRVDKLRKLFESVESTSIPTVYVADNGKMTQEKERLYSAPYDFNLTVFDLEYDSGVGNCRRVLSQRPNEDVLFFLDPDMTIPRNYTVLVDQLTTRETLGGVSGLLQEDSRIFTSASDIQERDGVLHRGHWKQKNIVQLADASFVGFDFIPQVGAFRQSCLEEYTWDDFYRTQREHIDFFVGHKQNTDWKFGISPQVLFPHFPGGSSSYQDHRQSKTKRLESHEYFCSKWEYDDLRVDDGLWIDTYPHYKSPDISERFAQKLRDDGVLETTRAIVRHISRQIS